MIQKGIKFNFKVAYHGNISWTCVSRCHSNHGLKEGCPSIPNEIKLSILMHLLLSHYKTQCFYLFYFIIFDHIKVAKQQGTPLQAFQTTETHTGIRNLLRNRSMF